MAEYIEREAAIAVCSAQYKECLRKSDWCGDTVAWNIGFNLKAIPAADVVEVKHGRWVKKFERYHDTHTDESWDEEYCSCPLCGKDSYLEHNYCPNCGARMDGE